MRLFLAHHGQTDDNLADILQGHKGKRLNSTGLIQAKKLARRLKDEKIDVAYVSILKRAIETGIPILKYPPTTPVIHTSKICERAFGIYDGRKKEEMNLAIQESGLPFHKYKPPEGESSEETQQRGMEWYNGILQEHSDQHILAITHGAFSSALRTEKQKEPTFRSLL